MEEAKKLKTVACYDEECDRFSDLSDELVCHVLSFLPTKAAYRSSVLSKRWALICTTILDLNFEIPEVSDSSTEIKSVYAVLLRRTENIRKLRLCNYNGCKPCDVHLWVSKALDLKVKELDLEFGYSSIPILPLRLFKSDSLVVLKLHGHIEFQPTLNSSYDIHLPSLKILHLNLYRLDFNKDHSEYDLLELLSGCPRLEEFCLHGNVKQPINISFPLLKRLDLSLWKFSDSVSSLGPLQINVQSSLEALDITDFSHKEYEFINLSNVDRATLSIIKYLDFNSLHKLLKGLSNVKSLTLTSETIRFLSMEDNLHNPSFLTFHELLSLSVGISENCNWSVLVGFLQNAPKLTDLIIEKKFKKNSQRKEVGNSSWVGPSTAPTCLSTGLITFEFKGIQNIKAEVDFMQYILYHSSKLEKVKIFIQKNSKKSVERSLLKGLKKSSTLALDINLI